MYHNEAQYEGKTNVWLTPKDLLDALGAFDLDPCAADPRPFDIGTKLNFTQADDGLAQEWPQDHFAFCNPPYGPHTGAWLDRMAQHNYGIALTFARTETRAMQRALRRCSAVFFPDKRVTFLTGKPPHLPGRTSGGAPSMLLAFGHMAALRLGFLKNGQLFVPVV
jgi:hypothetical protein